jgi:hypothetical protein
VTISVEVRDRKEEQLSFDPVRLTTEVLSSLQGALSECVRGGSPGCRISNCQLVNEGDQYIIFIEVGRNDLVDHGWIVTFVRTHLEALESLKGAQFSEVAGEEFGSPHTLVIKLPLLEPGDILTRVRIPMGTPLAPDAIGVIEDDPQLDLPFVEPVAPAPAEASVSAPNFFKPPRQILKARPVARKELME